MIYTWFKSANNTIGVKRAAVQFSKIIKCRLQGNEIINLGKTGAKVENGI